VSLPGNGDFLLLLDTADATAVITFDIKRTSGENPAPLKKDGGDFSLTSAFPSAVATLGGVQIRAKRATGTGAVTVSALHI
jgi:hypothetical protein